MTQNITETITVVKFYSNREVAEVLGCTPEYIRKLKSTKKDELEGFWRNDSPDGETAWSEDGLNKLSELVKTDKAKDFRAGQLARGTQEAIAVDRSALNYPNESQSSTRTGQDINSYEVPSPTASGGRYADLPERVGDAIGNTLADRDGIRRMDTQVVKSFLQAANLSDIGIDIEALLGRKS